MSHKIETYNFSLEKSDIKGLLEVEDKRNNIVSSGTDLSTFDFYINYLTTLQVLQDKWVNFGYMDMGMIPLAMGPSKVQILIHKFIVKLCIENNIKYYEMPAVSFMSGHIIKDIGKDIWVFREDIAKTVGIDPLAFSIIDYLSREEVKVLWELMYNAR